MMVIIRGTTPEISISVNLDLTSYVSVFSISQHHILSFKDERLIKTVQSGITTIKVILTQEESLTFEEGEALIQLKTKKDNVVFASKIKKVTFTKILNEDIL